VVRTNIRQAPAVVDDSKDQIEFVVRRNIPHEVITGRWQNG
jgi:hypothetical protein